MSNESIIDRIVSNPMKISAYDTLITSALFFEGKREKVVAAICYNISYNELKLDVLKKVFDQYKFTNDELYKIFGAINNEIYDEYEDIIELILCQLSKSKKNNIFFKKLSPILWWPISIHSIYK